MSTNSDLSQENLEKLRQSIKTSDFLHMFLSLEKLGNNLMMPNGILKKIEKLSHMLHSVPKEIWPVDVGYQNDLENATIESLLSSLRNDIDVHLKSMNELKSLLDNAIKLTKI